MSNRWSVFRYLLKYGGEWLNTFVSLADWNANDNQMPKLQAEVKITLQLLRHGRSGQIRIFICEALSLRSKFWFDSFNFSEPSMTAKFCIPAHDLKWAVPTGNYQALCMLMR
jgi:hypothetical protein